MNIKQLSGNMRRVKDARNDKKERLVDVIVIYKNGDEREETLDYYPYELDKVLSYFTSYSFMDLIKEIKVRTGGQYWTTIFKDGHVNYDIYEDGKGWQTIDYDFVPEKGKSSYDYVPRNVSDSRRVQTINRRKVKDSTNDLMSLVEELSSDYTNGRFCRLRSSNLIDEMLMSQGDMIDILDMITSNNQALCDAIENMIDEYNEEQEYGNWTDWGHYCREAMKCVKTARGYCYEFLDLIKGGSAADYATLIDNIDEALRDEYYSQLL